MRIYKVLTNVFEYNRRKDIRINSVHHEEVVINNLEYAKAIYIEREKELKSSFSYSVRGTERTGTVQLFTPHVHKNGLLAYWPDNDKYILKRDFTD